MDKAHCGCVGSGPWRRSKDACGPQCHGRRALHDLDAHRSGALLAVTLMTWAVRVALMASGSGDAAGARRRDTACNNAHGRPPEIAGPDHEGAVPANDLRGAALPRPPAAVPATTLAEGAAFVVPTTVITIRDKHLDDSYIEELMKEKGLNEAQIALIRSLLRRYIDSFLEGRDIKLDDSSYRLLTNLIVHLIEESSK